MKPLKPSLRKLCDEIQDWLEAEVDQEKPDYHAISAMATALGMIEDQIKVKFLTSEL